MKLIANIIKLIVLIILIFISLNNTQVTPFFYLPTQAFNMPLIVLLLITFIVGSIVGIFSMLGRTLSLRHESNQLHTDLKKTQNNLKQIENDHLAHAPRAASEQRNIVVTSAENTNKTKTEEKITNG